MKTKLVLKEQSLENVANNTFVFCTELKKGFIKRDLSPLNITDYSFQNVVALVEAMDLPTIESNKLNSVLFKNGEEKISKKTELIVEKMISELPNENKTTDFIANFLNNKRQKADYFDDEFVSDMIMRLPSNKLDILDDGSCIACYNLNGDANDLSGNYNGTWSGNETYVNGKFGQSASFDGNSHIKIPKPLDNLPMSISMFVTTTQEDEGNKGWKHPLLIGFATSGGGSNDFGIEVKNGYLHMFNGFSGNHDVYTTSQTKISDGNTHLVIITFSDAQIHIYCDSILVYTEDINKTAISGSNFYIGKMNEDEEEIQKGFIGEIDQVRIFNEALTVDNVLTLTNILV